MSTRTDVYRNLRDAQRPVLQDVKGIPGLGFELSKNVLDYNANSGRSVAQPDAAEAQVYNSLSLAR